MQDSLKSGDKTLILNHGGTSVVFLAAYWGPSIAYIGPRFQGVGEDLAPLYNIGLPEAGKDTFRTVPLLPTGGDGWQSGVAVQAVDSDGRATAVTWRHKTSSQDAAGIHATYESRYALAHIAITPQVGGSIDLTLRVEPRTRLSHIGVNIPIDPCFQSLRHFSGRWCAEFQQETTSLDAGRAIHIDNIAGRTSHVKSPHAILETSYTNAEHGPCLGMALHETGDFEIAAERHPDGRGGILLGRRLNYTDQPQELTVTLAYSNTGRQALARQTQSRVRSKVWGDEIPTRMVHYNTWEGLYFDHKPERLSALVKHAKALGVERWVLDDGWFLGRNDDTSSLGDWQVDPVKYPNGLTPLIKEVNDAGMSFGLWVEPEMVNAESNLYRAHPDWVLRHGSAEAQVARHQQVLNLSLPEVQDFIVTTVCDLLSNHNIDYLKWDMNRDTWQKYSADGHKVTSGFGDGVLSVLARIMEAHPNVEIESCASGGARINYAILGDTKRVWTSDSNDAIERQRIQAGARLFYPTAALGSHIGPRHCHTSGRNLSMSFRAQTALFAHFGMEMDLTELTKDETSELVFWINAYKTHRSLIHSGDVLQFNRRDPNEIVFGVEGETQSLVQIAQLDRMAFGLPEPLRLTFTKEDAQYRITPISPDGLPLKKQVLNKVLPPVWAQDEIILSGSALHSIGLPLPCLLPASALTLLIKEIQ